MASLKRVVGITGGILFVGSIIVSILTLVVFLAMLLELAVSVLYWNWEGTLPSLGLGVIVVVVLSVVRFILTLASAAMLAWEEEG